MKCFIRELNSFNVRIKCFIRELNNLIRELNVLFVN